MSEWTLHFDYSSAPLTANARLHHHQRARLVRKVRGETLDLADGIGHLGRCRVTLTWFVTTKHRRDVDNIVPTLKAMCDGLVDAGLVEDDTPEFMEKVMPAIELIPKDQGPAHMKLRIEKI